MGTDWLVLDFDGVIRHWDGRHFEQTAVELGLTGHELATIALSDELLGAAMIGDLTAEEWQAEIGRRVAERHGCSADEVATAFSEVRWAIDGRVVDIVQDVRRVGAARVALFSNASTRLERDIALSGLDGLFDRVANSSRIKMVKPDPAAFTHVAGLLGTEPAACLFVDDQERNVEGARTAGMRAERFVSADELHALLADEGLL